MRPWCLALLVVAAGIAGAAHARSSGPVDLPPRPAALGSDWDDGREWDRRLREPAGWPRPDLVAAGFADMVHDERSTGCADRAITACGDIASNRRGLARISRIAGGELLTPPLKIRF